MFQPVFTQNQFPVMPTLQTQGSMPNEVPPEYPFAPPQDHQLKNDLHNATLVNSVQVVLFWLG